MYTTVFTNDDDIVNHYKNYMDKGVDRIQILSDLTLKPKKEIVKILHEHGVEIGEVAKPRELVKEEREAEFLRLYNQGLTDMKIARKMHICEMTVFYWRQGNSLLSQQELKGNKRAECLALHNQGLSDYEIAKATGLSHSTVYRWRLKGYKKNRPAGTETVSAN